MKEERGHEDAGFMLSYSFKLHMEVEDGVSTLCCGHDSILLRLPMS